MCLEKELIYHPKKHYLYFFGGRNAITSETIGNVYKNEKNSDGFLYATISVENTFG